MKILVADKFINGKNLEKNFISLFPSGNEENTHCFTLNELFELSKIQSKYIDSTLDELLPIIKKILGIKNDNYKVLFRPYLVALINIFTDRSIRVLMLLKDNNKEELSYLDVKNYKDFNTLHDLTDTIVNSWHLNQLIINKLLMALGVKSIKYPGKLLSFEYPQLNSSKNLMLRPDGKKKYLNNILFKFLNLLPISNNRILSYGLKYDSYYLKKSGLSGPFGIIDEKLPKKIILEKRSSTKRSKLKNESSKILQSVIIKIFKESIYNFDDNLIKKISLCFPNMFADFIPVSFFESAKQNVEQYDQILKKRSNKFVFGAGFNSYYGFFLSTACKIAGLKVIGYQHGGHYGYIEDNFQHAQIEYKLYDEMVTWGWNKIDDHFPQINKIISLPVPLYSERPITKKINLKKKYQTKDFLFMSNKLHRFPGVTTSGVSRIDFIKEYKILLKELVKKVRINNLNMIHKPFDQKTVLILNELFMELENIGKNNYSTYKNYNKGISTELVKSANLIVWDQIGTGTMQCFSSGIPTIVLWKRIYSREVAWEKDLFKKMEKCGIIHTSVDSLILEIKKFNQRPEQWIKNPVRKSAISEFCNKFAFHSNDWKKIWIKTFKENYLSANV